MTTTAGSWILSSNYTKINDTTVFIDRRIKVIEGPERLHNIERELRVSDIRPYPYVVFLGEPGCGKSTIFKDEANIGSATLINARQFLSVQTDSPGTSCIFIDAFDEFSTDASTLSNADAIENKLKTSRIQKWRISCRSADWRPNIYFKTHRQATSDQKLVIAQILPLNQEEATKILIALNEEKPESFFEHASSLGCEAFIESPLSLKLLHSAIKNDANPKNRFDLFHLAIEQLAREYNDYYAEALQNPFQPEQLILTASKLSLVLLVSNKQYISKNFSDINRDNNCLYADDHGLDREIVNSTLNTAIFKGHNFTFEPMHRTIAEFLAGKALADAVTRSAITDSSRPPYPLSRAIAMIAGEDKTPPTSLRGTFAWLTAHLAKMGDEDNVIRLIQHDADSIIVYGDTSTLSVTTCKELLKKFGRMHVNFRSFTHGTLSLGGLSRPELISDFQQILSEEINDENTHRQYTLFESISDGPYLPNLKNFLREIILNPKKVLLQRELALNAYKKTITNILAEYLEIFDQLSHEQSPESKAILQSIVATILPFNELGIDRLKETLSGIGKASIKNENHPLLYLQRKAEATPPLGLFEEKSETWIRQTEYPPIDQRINYFLDCAFSSLISHTPKLDEKTLLKWVLNDNEPQWTQARKKTITSIGIWIGDNKKKELALFDAILGCREFLSEKSNIKKNGLYSRISGKTLSPENLETIVKRIPSSPDKDFIINEAISHLKFSLEYRDIYFLLVELTSNPTNPHHSRHQYLTFQYLDPDKLYHYSEQSKFIKNRTLKRHTLRQNMTKLSNGQNLQELNEASAIYFSSRHLFGKLFIGLENVKIHYDETISRAIISGWNALLETQKRSNKNLKIALKDENQLSLLAAISLLLEAPTRTLTDIPVEISYSAMRNALKTNSTEKRTELLTWAASRIEENEKNGTKNLIDFFQFMIDNNEKIFLSISTLEKVEGIPLAQITECLCESRPNMDIATIYMLAEKFSAQWGFSRIKTLTSKILKNGKLSEKNKEIWSTIAFWTNPKSYEVFFKEVFVAKKLPNTYSKNFDEIIQARIDDNFIDDYIHRQTLIISEFGPNHHPKQKDHSNYRIIQEIKRAIYNLATTNNKKSGQAIRQLIENTLLTNWKQELEEAKSIQDFNHRDNQFFPSNAKNILNAIAGGPPASPADIQAIILEEFRLLELEIRRNDTSSWKRFWNTDKYEKPINPIHENLCRDYLLERLRDRLKSYKLIVQPEIRRSDSTRVDIMVSSPSASTLPIEAKRNMNSGLWVAASTQLKKYADTQDSGQFGIYLVFWFGERLTTPTHRKKPSSAANLKKMLLEKLPIDSRDKLEVFVFDVAADPEQISKTHTIKEIKKPTRKG